MKIYLIVGLIILKIFAVFSQKVTVISPNQKINIDLINSHSDNDDKWYLNVNYNVNGKIYKVIPIISLGLSRNDQKFIEGLKFIKAGKPKLINIHPCTEKEVYAVTRPTKLLYPSKTLINQNLM